ncbi:MAG: hypothetical protein HC805_08030 [Alkalinema sp. RL_2_19]|nr:hypothetical protein [Alkalinema sp. RL_2_19]
MEQFRMSLAPSLGLAPVASIEEIHDRLLELCLTRSTIIALYDTPDMSEGALTKLLDEFWHPFVSHLEAQSGHIYQGRVFAVFGWKSSDEILEAAHYSSLGIGLSRVFGEYNSVRRRELAQNTRSSSTSSA